jgi:hypothetical protein
MSNWINFKTQQPTKEGYYEVMFEDKTIDEKPFRIRPNKNIFGFMTEREVICWREIK